VQADAACLVADGSALVILQIQRPRQATGEEVVKQIVTVADPGAVVGLEFMEMAPQALQALGVSLPAVRASGSHPGTLTRPRTQ
jgi:hypothetical protein